MFDSPFYIIKKWNFWIPIPIKFCVFIPIAYILIPIIAIIPMYLDYKNGEFEEDFVVVSIFFAILIIYWIFLLKEAIKIKRIKDIKYNWWWIVKKVKVTSIWKTKINKNYWSKIYIYYIEAEDWEMRYISNGSTKWVLLWTSMPELELLYAKYWFTFDEQERHKDALLKKFTKFAMIRYNGKLCLKISGKTSTGWSPCTRRRKPRMRNYVPSYPKAGLPSTPTGNRYPGWKNR